MTTNTSRTTIIALIVCFALPAWGQQYLLYSPQPVTPGQKDPSRDGILVQEIEIQKGDTLYGLSRKFSGRGTYFPQILLFNSIKNPNLIYAGKTLRIPVNEKETQGSDGVDTRHKGASRKPKRAKLRTEAPPAAQQLTESSPIAPPNTELSLNELNRGGRSKRKTTVQANKKQSPDSAPDTTATPAASTVQKSAADAAGSKLFEAAVKAYRQDDCRTALELLDRYLSTNSGSALAADANLYKAECYLKLSAQ